MSVPPARLTPRDLELGTSRALGTTATLVQVSSTFCAPCRAARSVLQHVAATAPGVLHVELDVAHQPRLAEQLAISRTPTMLLLDAHGTVLSRHVGVPRLAAVRAAVAALGSAH